MFAAAAGAACGHAPMGQLTLHVLGPNGLKPKDVTITLAQGGKKLPATTVTPASKLLTRPSIVLLVQTNEGFMTDAHDSVKDALTPLAAVGGDEAKVALVTYGDSVDTKVDFVPAKEFLSAAIGDAGDYSDEGINLLDGLGEAIKLLENAPGRRILIVIGDGSSTVNSGENTAESILRKIPELDIEVYSIHVPVDDTDDNRNRMKAIAMFGGFSTGDIYDIPDIATDVAKQISDTYFVTFEDPLLPLDGKDHDATLNVKDQNEDFTFNLAAPRPGESTVKTTVLKLIVAGQPDDATGTEGGGDDI